MRERIQTRALLFISLICLFCSELKSQEADCPTPRKVANNLICLPDLSGMTECYSEIRDHVDNFMIDANQTIAIYLNDSIYQHIDNIDDLIFADYFVVYTEKKLINQNINSQFIEALDSLITSTRYKQVIDENWDRIKSELKTKTYLSIDRPVLIDHYYIFKNMPSMISIGRFSGDRDNRVYLASTVIASVNNKFIAFQYYLFHEGESSIQKVKSMTEYFARIMVELNPASMPKKDSQENLKVELNPPSMPKKDSQENLKMAVEFFNKAYSVSQQGNYQKAINLYTSAINAYPSDDSKRKSEAFYNRGLNKRFLNDFTGATEDYSEAIELQPEYYKAYNNRGYLNLRLSKFVRAIEDFDYIINSADSPSILKASAYGNRGQSKFHIGQDGCSDMQKAIDLGGQGFLSAFKEKCK